MGKISGLKQMRAHVNLSKPQIALIGVAAVAGMMSFIMTATADEEAPRARGQVEAENLETAIFAGGCFWCVEADFDKVTGVVETVSGYTGGTVSEPTYKQVSYEDTGHYEAVKIVYNSAEVSYSELVEYFWRHVDPTDAGGQFCDRGPSYRTAIFPLSDEQRDTAEMSKAALDASEVLSEPVVTPILDAATFWPAEDYHQDYYQKNRLRYTYYRNGCGRDARIKDVWQNAPDTSADKS